MGEPLQTLVTLLGGGGLTAVILGILGYLKGRDADAPEQRGPGMTLAALYADQASILRVSMAFERHADALDRQTDAIRDNTEAFRDRTRRFRNRE